MPIQVKSIPISQLITKDRLRSGEKSKKASSTLCRTGKSLHNSLKPNTISSPTHRAKLREEKGSSLLLPTWPDAPPA